MSYESCGVPHLRVVSLRALAACSIVLLSAGAAASCASRGLPAGAEARSLLGEPLVPPPLSEEVRADRERRLAEARADYEADPDDPEALIWLGRRTAYLGRYREAIDIFGEGVRRHPADPRFYRHRGHRLITVRRFDDAIRDLSRAAFLIEGTDDEVEPDGLPNERGIPTSTLHFNVHYHLALAHYLEGDYERALAAWRRTLEVSKNPDSEVAARYWLYLVLRRLGRDGEAAGVLAPVKADMDVIENHAYHRLLLLFRGERTAAELSGGGEDALQNASLGYGVGAWNLVSGRRAEAERVFREVLEGAEWAAFGFIAAEAEITRGSR